MGSTLEIGLLGGGGLVLGYRCTSKCRHCLYGCGPHRRDGHGALLELEQLLDSLAVKGPHAHYHIGGGEPFLWPGLLEAAISGFGERGLYLDYVETNAMWAKDEAFARAMLRRMVDVGLRSLLVSVSPFHAKHVPVIRTRTLARVAQETLPGGAFLWLPDFFPDLESAGDGTLDLEQILARRGSGYARALTERYGLIAGGRAGRFLAAHGVGRPWAEFDGPALCRQRLADTSHFHVDLEGLYVPGLCAGIVLPLADVPGPVALDRYPILAALVVGGAAGLARLAMETGFEPLRHYASACDLCTHARFHLASEDFAELGPAGFYDPRSVEFE